MQTATQQLRTRALTTAGQVATKTKQGFSWAFESVRVRFTEAVAAFHARRELEAESLAESKRLAEIKEMPLNALTVGAFLLQPSRREKLVLYEGLNHFEIAEGGALRRLDRDGYLKSQAKLSWEIRVEGDRVEYHATGMSSAKVAQTNDTIVLSVPFLLKVIPQHLRREAK